MDKILKQKVYHDGRSMVVLKAGDDHDVPANRRQTFIDEGVIADGPAPVDDGVSHSGFAMEHVGFGKYSITGPGLDEPEIVKGKKEAAARVAELAQLAEDGGTEDEDAGAPAE